MPTFESLLSHIHPRDRGKLVDQLQKLISRPLSCEVGCTAYVGDPPELRNLSIFAKSKWDAEQNRVRVIYGAVKDITESKTAAEALRNNDSHLRSVIQATPVVLWDMGKDGTIRLSEGSALEKLGLKSGQLVGKSVFDVFNDAPEVLTNIRRGLTGAEITAETQISDTYWRSHFVPRHDDRGSISGLVGVSVDITDRKKAEESLRESEQKYRILFDTEMFAIHVFDVETLRIIDANEAHSQLYGYSRDELLSDMTVLDLASEPNECDDTIDQIKRGSSTYVPLRYHRKKDGTNFPVAIVNTSCEWNGRKVCFGTIHDISERKRAEEDSPRIRGLLAISQSLAHIGSWEYDALAQRMMWSDEMYRITNISPSVPMTPDIAKSFLPPEELARYRKCIEDGQPYSGDYKISRPDGQIRIVHSEGEVELDENQKLVRTFGTMQDVTELRKAEQALQQKTRIVGSLYENVSEIIFYLDVEAEGVYRFQSVNPAFLRATGLEESQVVGKLFSEVISDASSPLGELNVRKAIQNQEIIRWEEITPRPSGDRVGEVTVAPVYDEAGICTNIIVTVYEITQQKKVEAALRENEKRLLASEAKYKELIDTAPVAIFVFQNEKIVFLNKSAPEMSGYSREELLGMPARAFFSDADWEKSRNHLLERLSGKILPKRITSHKKKNGDSFWAESVGELIDWEGKPAVLYFVSDITDRKAAENERIEYEQYLQQAQRLESLGVLAGGIAHDFNNILTGIFGYADLARSEAKDEAVSRYLSQAMESMERAKSLTQQLLTFSRGGAPVKKAVPMPSFIRETCQFALHGSNVKGKYDIQENLSHCEIDKNQIGQVIQNLILNAIQAMPMGGIIEISAKNTSMQPKEHPTLSEGSYVAVSIKDQGIGIPEDMLSRVFDPFFTTKTEGHGLGLAISHSIITRHGGAIDVRSELGKGTTFTVYLLACDESCAETLDSNPIRHTGTGRILIMDDEGPIRELLSKMLQSFGYSVVAKENGGETIEAFLEGKRNNNPFKAVILDLTIPGEMGGKEVAEEIRQIDKEVPLFVASGYAVDPIIARPGEYGFTASISKPFKMADLMEMLEKHLRPVS